MRGSAAGAMLLALLALALPASAQPQGPDPMSRLEPAQRRVVQQLLQRETKDDQGGTEVVGIEQADLDGDGKRDLVVLWTFLGPTYWWSRVSVFTQVGGAWRAVGSTAAPGIVERLRVHGREIAVDAKTHGPNDARCCPSRKTVHRIRWQGGKLLSSAR